jgi:hypothetical protein
MKNPVQRMFGHIATFYGSKHMNVRGYLNRHGLSQLVDFPYTAVFNTGLGYPDAFDPSTFRKSSLRMKKRAESMEEFAELHARNFDPEESVGSIQDYRPLPTDVVITPFGKCGTTWTQQIFHTLRTRGDMDFDDISRVVPWIETARRLGLDINAEQKAEPRGFKSHLGYDKLPRGARFINVIRHPLDAAYSGFKFMEGWYLEPGAVSPETYIKVRARDASYHKHFVSWWPHRDDADVLYLVYEHMKADPERHIERIAEFVGIPLDDELRAITLEHSSLEFMQTHKDRFDDAMLRRLSEEELLPSGSDSAKVRAGQIHEFSWSDEIVDLYDSLWLEHVTRVTGFESYEALIASLAGIDQSAPLVDAR